MAAIEGTFSGTASGAMVLVQGGFNISVWGDEFVGTVKAQRSFDGGNSWADFTYVDGTPLSWSVEFSTTFDEPEEGVVWRVVCIEHTSGDIYWRISQ